MNAQDQRITNLLNSARQFVIPIFQRDYRWGTLDCKQLWDDIIRVGSDKNAKAHFIGSVVYIAAEETNAAISRWLVIDGQQRMTTVILLFAAIRDYMKLLSQDEILEYALSPDAIEDYYLINQYGRNDQRYKLNLRKADHESITAILDGRELADESNNQTKENYEFFKGMINKRNLHSLQVGIGKLVVVDVCLSRGQDDPQMIFESLNSTGKRLSQSDLIRNFVLMQLAEPEQNRLYSEQWQPLETVFENKRPVDFDEFITDYLTLQTKPSRPLKVSDAYIDFRIFYRNKLQQLSATEIIEHIRRFAKYYAFFNFETEPNKKLKAVLSRLRSITELGSPVVMALYNCYENAKSLSTEEFIEGIELIESYIFRRSICDMQTRSLGKILSTLSFKINVTQPLISLKIALVRLEKKRKFPDDNEFLEALLERDVFNIRHKKYLLDRLENFNNKEPSCTDNYTVEHVLPQNKKLNSDWKKMLGQDWKKDQEIWLHRLGNLTLTGYNSTYSDRSFEEKKSIDGGFNESTLRLNRYIREASVWTAETIEKRTAILAKQSLKVWPIVIVDQAAVRRSALEDLQSDSSKYKLEDIDFSDSVKVLFNDLNERILKLGSEVITIPKRNTIVYHVNDFFVEVLPRANKLLLLLNLDFDSIDDPSGTAKDATESAFIVNASEQGGVVFSIFSASDIDPAMHLVKQSYELAQD